MKAIPRFIASLLALAALAPCALRAERIDPATDLLKGELPTTQISVSGGATSGRYGGDVNNVWALLNDNDAQYTMFYMSSIEDPGCYVDFTIGLNQAFTPSQCFNTYAIRVAKFNSSTTVERSPKKWQVWGKTDEEGAEWVLLDTETDQTDWQFADNGGLEEGTVGAAASPGETRYYHFENGGVRYKYLRFRFLENNGHATYMALSQIILYTAATPASSATAETFAGCADLVPAATSATASRYTSTTHPIASDFGSGNASAAFSDSLSRVLFKLDNSTGASSANLIYEFGADDRKIVNGYMVRFTDHQYTAAGRAPFAWIFSGSDDGAAWTTLDARTDQLDWTNGEARYYRFDNHDAYAFYKIEFTSNNGGNLYYELGPLDYYYLAEDGVFFSGLDTSVSDGTLAVSGSLTSDSLAADLTLRGATNGIPFSIDLGALSPGEAFSASLPIDTGVAYGVLTGVSANGAYTNEVAFGPLAAGSGAALFVSPDGDDAATGLSQDAPKRHIAAAVAALGAAGGTVCVLPGTYAETNDLSAVELAAPVSVIGVTGDPADVVVTQVASCGYARIFKLDNASALVRSLTMSGGHVQNEPKDGYTAAEANASASASVGTGVSGGNLWIAANGGVVENCVIEDGTVRRYGQAGGNAYMQGGRLSRCVLTGGDLVGTHGISHAWCGTSLLADGGLVESCLFTGTTDAHVAPVCVGGSATLLNCTVAGNSATECGGVLVKGNNSRIVNTVIYGNTATAADGNAVYRASTAGGSVPSDAAAAFANCASDGDAAINATCLLVGASAFADAANGDYAPTSSESALVNAGADYAAAGGVSPLDIAGAPRLWGSRPDIGAWEFQYEIQHGTVMFFR